MLNKKSMKILSIMLIVIMLLMTIGNVVLADNISDNFKNENLDTKTIQDTAAADIAKTILGTMKWIGVAVAVGMLMFLGIKYITSSPEGKADLKGKLGVYILGFVLLIAATSIVAILETTFGKL